MTTQAGTVSSLPVMPAATSSIQMMPMVFWASLPPCPRLYSDEEKSCSRRNRRSTRVGVERMKIHEIASSSTEPIRNPSSGEMKMNATVFRIPAGISAQPPAFATAAAHLPPLGARLDDGRKPQYEVGLVQLSDAISATNTTDYPADECAM